MSSAAGAAGCPMCPRVALVASALAGYRAGDEAGAGDGTAGPISAGEIEPAAVGAVALLPRCAVYLCEDQGPPGWCVLALREHADHLADLPPSAQAEVFAEVSAVAGALRKVFAGGGVGIGVGGGVGSGMGGSVGGGPPRINYACLGNVVPHVHWHVIPRLAGDPFPQEPVWSWPEERRRGTMSAPARAALARTIAGALRGTVAAAAYACP